MDDLKDKLDIKDIVNNVEIFKNFDVAYKQLGRIQNEKLKNNLNNFKELNQTVSNLIINYIDIIYNAILENLKKILNDEKFSEIKVKIAEKYVRPVNQNDIINFNFS